MEQVAVMGRRGVARARDGRLGSPPSWSGLLWRRGRSFVVVVGVFAEDALVEADEGEVGDEVLDDGVFLLQNGGIAAGGNDLWVGAVEVGGAFDLHADGAAEGGDDAEGHGVGGVLAEGPASGLGGSEGQVGEGGGALMEGAKHEAEPGEDDAAMEDALAVDEVDGDGGAGVDDHTGLFGAGEGGDGVEEAVLADGRVVIERVADGDGQVASEADRRLGVVELGEDGVDAVGRGIVDGSEDGGGRFRSRAEEAVEDLPSVGLAFAGEGGGIGKLAGLENSRPSPGVSDGYCEHARRMVHPETVALKRREAVDQR